MTHGVLETLVTIVEFAHGFKVSGITPRARDKLLTLLPITRNGKQEVSGISA